MSRALLSREPERDPIWALTPFIDFTGRHGSYFFEWEREWRHVGNLIFYPEDVAFLIMPEEFHESAVDFFKEIRRENTGPAYFCPYIDANWSRERCAAALRAGSPALQSKR